MSYVVRGKDNYGAGYFGASRGERKHVGIDLVLDSGKEFFSFNQGVVSKLGYPYKDALGYRYVQVTNADGSAWRYFYVTPMVKLGQIVKKGQVLGITQDLQARYPGITPHVHFEIMKNAEYVDPTYIVQAV